MSTATHTLEGPDLEELLARVPDELGPDATIVAANKLRSGGLAGFFAKERFEVVIEVPEHPGATTRPPRALRVEPLRAQPDAAPIAPTVPSVSTEHAGFASVLDRMVRDAGVEDMAPRAVGPALAEVPDIRASHVVDAPFEPLVAAPVPRPLPVVRPRAIEPRSSFLAPAALERLGLPAELAAGEMISADDPTVELLRIMDQLERPDDLPSGAGSLIAVVGPRSEAMEVAERFAAEIGTRRDEILLASRTSRWAKFDPHRRIDGIDVVLERRRAWRRRQRPTIIAIESEIGPREGEWASEVLEAMDPAAVWGVVDATRKPEDIHSWSRQLGGLDALAVYGIEATTSPAAVLNVGVPVGLLDGHEATALRWTSILADHLGLAA